MKKYQRCVYGFGIGFLCLIGTVSAQLDGYTPELPVQNTTQYRQANMYQQDFLYLCDGLMHFHANVFATFPQEDFQQQKMIAFHRLATCDNIGDFEAIAQKFTNHIKDRHTGLRIKRDTEPTQIYPFRTKYLQDTLVIMAVSDPLPLSICGERIESLNGISIETIEERASTLSAAENEVHLQNNIMLSINRTDYLKELGVIQSDTQQVKMGMFSGKLVQVSPQFNGRWQSQIPAAHHLTDRQPKPFLHQIVSEDSLCYLQLNKMMDKRVGLMYLKLLPFWKRVMVKTIRLFGGSAGIPRDNFEDFLNQCLADIQQNHIRKVIVDLRWNPGGSYLLGDQLLYAFGVDKYRGYRSEIRESALYHLQRKALGQPEFYTTTSDTSQQYHITGQVLGAKKIKQRFHGQVYFIVSEWTFSSAVQLATVVKDNHLFPVVGEPISERPSHFGEVLFLKLPNTKGICSLSCKQFHRPDTSRDYEDTLYPDVSIRKTYTDIIHGVDRAYQWIAEQ